VLRPRRRQKKKKIPSSGEQRKLFDGQDKMTIQTTLILSALFALLAASLYAYIGWRLGKRVVATSGARLAWQSFTLWWYGLAAITLIGGFQSLLGAWGLTILPVFVTAAYVNILVICIALGGLLYYLIYLFTGNSRWLVPLIIFYIVYYVLLVYFITASTPENINLESWSTALDYRTPIRGPFFAIVIILLIVPHIIGGLSYFLLFFRVQEVTQKYRIFLVSWSIIIWFLSPVIGLAGGFSESDWWQLVSRIIGLGAALTILMAYLPPQWLKSRYGITSLSDENPNR
jgi:hypothetical protein